MSGRLGPRINDAILSLVTLEHRIDRYFRDGFNRIFQQPLTNLVRFLLRLTHSNLETSLCQEIPIEGEAECTQAIIQLMAEFTKRECAGRVAQRAVNTKTYGVVSAEFEVLPDVPARFRKGVGARTKIPRNPPDDWLRQAMAATLSRQEILIDFLVQVEPSPAKYERACG